MTIELTFISSVRILSSDFGMIQFKHTIKEKDNVSVKSSVGIQYKVSYRKSFLLKITSSLETLHKIRRVANLFQGANGSQVCAGFRGHLAVQSLHLTRVYSRLEFGRPAEHDTRGFGWEKAADNVRRSAENYFSKKKEKAQQNFLPVKLIMKYQKIAQPNFYQILITKVETYSRKQSIFLYLEISESFVRAISASSISSGTQKSS